MRFRLSFFIVVLISLGCSSLSAQHYKRLMDEGYALLKKEDFIMAGNKFKAAKFQAQNAENNEWRDKADQAVEQAREGYFNKVISLQDNLIKAKEQTIRERRELETKRRILAWALKTSFVSRDEVDRDSFYRGLLLAYQAKDSTEAIGIDDPFVDRTFADASYHYYKKDATIGVQPFKGAAVSLARPQLAYYGVSPEFVRVECSNNLQLGTFLVDAHQKYITYATYSEKGEKFVSCSQDGTAKVWDAEGNLLHLLEGHGDAVVYAVFNEDATEIITCSRDSTARLWALDGTNPASKILPVGAHVLDASFLSGGKAITRSADRKTSLWAADQALSARMEHGLWNRVATFSPQSNLILSAGFDHTPKLWDMDGRLVRELLGHHGAVLSACFSPDGQRILTTSADETAIVWNLDGNIIARSTRHGHPVTHGVYDAEGKYFLTIAKGSNNAWVWDASDGTLKAKLDNHTDVVNSAVFSPDGKGILTASDDRTAKLWSLKGELLMNMGRFPDAVKKALFFPANDNIIGIISEGGHFTACYTPEEAWRMAREEISGSNE